MAVLGHCCCSRATLILKEDGPQSDGGGVAPAADQLHPTCARCGLRNNRDSAGAWDTVTPSGPATDGHGALQPCVSIRDVE